MKSVPMALAVAFFAVFLANVLMGAAGKIVFLNDVHEMLCLFAACFFFVVAVLVLERERDASGNDAGNSGRNDIG